MTKPLTIEHIEAAFAIAAERLRRPKLIYKIERLMGDDVLLAFTDGNYLCIDDDILDERVKEMKRDDRLDRTRG